MKLNEDWRFRDDIKADTVPIEILTEPYKGVILRYTKVAIKEKENDSAVLNFEYELFEMGKHTEVALRKDKKFEYFAGLVLNSLILESVEGPNDNAKSGEDDTEGFVEE